MEYHPDRNGSAEADERFKEINEAYEVLSDPQKRAFYDRYGKNPGNGGENMGGFETFEFGGLGDIFEAFFGGAASTAQNVPRARVPMSFQGNLSFEECYTGITREVEITRIELCATCKGVGSRPGTNPDKCPECNGIGTFMRGASLCP